MFPRSSCNPTLQRLARRQAFAAPQIQSPRQTCSSLSDSRTTRQSSVKPIRQNRTFQPSEHPQMNLFDELGSARENGKPSGMMRRISPQKSCRSMEWRRKHRYPATAMQHALPLMAVNKMICRPFSDKKNRRHYRSGIRATQPPAIPCHRARRAAHAAFWPSRRLVRQSLPYR